jgi:hypothetical protein
MRGVQLGRRLSFPRRENGDPHPPGLHLQVEVMGKRAESEARGASRLDAEPGVAVDLDRRHDFGLRGGGVEGQERLRGAVGGQYAARRDVPGGVPQGDEVASPAALQTRRPLLGLQQGGLRAGGGEQELPDAQRHTHREAHAQGEGDQQMIQPAVPGSGS